MVIFASLFVTLVMILFVVYTTVVNWADRAPFPLFDHLFLFLIFHNLTVSVIVDNSVPNAIGVHLLRKQYIILYLHSQ